jgi:transposase-like protein
MYVQGVSTRKVAKIVEQMCGFSVSSAQVSRAAAQLDEMLEVWRNRPLGRYRYLLVDARYEKIRQGGQVLDGAVLWAAGVDEHGKRDVLGVSVALSEAEVHWRTFLQSLTARGLHGVELIASDDHAGLRAARKAVFTGVPWQRCQFHLQQNAQKYAPRQALKRQVADDIRSVFNAPDRVEAERLVEIIADRHEEKAPRLADWMRENLGQGLAVFALPPTHRRRMRTTNLMERTNQEIKRRTRVARVFPNEASCLRLVSAILIEIAEEWQTGKAYINLKEENETEN